MNYEEFVGVMELVAANWRDILGVDCYVNFDKSINIFTGVPEALIIPKSWKADYPDPDNFLRMSLSDTMFIWRNATFSRLVEQAKRLTDQDERMRLYQQADQILVNEAVIIPFVHRNEERLVKPWLLNRISTPWKDVFIEPH
jgi:ABC-type transport system substrate-binding protein